MTESVDGHRWPQRATSPEDVPVAPVDAPRPTETPRTPAPDQQPAGAADASRPVETPPAGSALDGLVFDVFPGYTMHPDSVALHFHVDLVPALAELFPAHADALHAAALDVEMESERQQDATAWRAS